MSRNAVFKVEFHDRTGEDPRTIEAYRFHTKEGFLVFTVWNGNSDMPVAAFDAEMVMAVTKQDQA